jgi:hypothetical protein
MCCKKCCTCDCNFDEDRSDNYSLQEFLDSNDHPDSERLTEFLTFFKNYQDPLVNDASWYTEARLLELFNNLRVLV